MADDRGIVVRRSRSTRWETRVSTNRADKDNHNLPSPGRDCRGEAVGARASAGMEIPARAIGEKGGQAGL